MISKHIFSVVIFFGIALNANSQDGASDNSELKKFEKSIKASKKAGSENSDQSRNRQHNSADSGSNILGEVITELVIELGSLTAQRLDSEVDSEYRRLKGEILIPYVRYDYTYQNISENIGARSNRLEIGYGPVALQMEEYVFKEYIPVNTMTLNRQLFLYRISPSPIMEIDIGLGSTIISGLESITLSSVALPVKIPFNKNFAIEFIPVWSSSMKDYEFALHMGKGNYGSFRVGYRSLSTPEMMLNGPFAGFAIYY